MNKNIDNRNSNYENIIFGRNPVKEALRANKVIKLYLQNGFDFKEILELSKNVDVTYVKQNVIDMKADGIVHQGCYAVIKPFNYSSIDEIIFKAKKKEQPLIVLLDGINDPHNLGAIIRSSDVFAVDGIIIPKHNQVPVNATVAKTSAGAINYVPVAISPNLNQTIKKLKDEGFWVVSSDGSAKISYSELKYDFPVALVIGSEGKGVSRLVLENSDYIIKIPQNGHVNSLNASVAAGILLSRIRSK